MSRAPLRLGTRGSALARAQAVLAAAALGGETEVVVVRTRGDRDQTTPAAAMEGQGWFTAELEAALLDGRVDVAVHSGKDLPTRLAPGLAVCAHLTRGDARDGVVSRHGGLDALPPGARVGTSAPRREALLAAARPDVRVVAMRGNVDTRLRRLDEGEVDALLLACAGVDRLGLGDRLAERLDPRRFVPSPAQGAIALEARAGGEAAAACGAVADEVTGRAVRAERAVLVALGGGCLLPLGAWARMEEGRLVLSAALGGGAAEEVRRAELAGEPSRPEELGEAVAERLR